MIEITVQRFSRIDLWVNNAGFGLNDSLASVDIAQARQLFDTNLFGVMECMQAVIPVMKQQGGGDIVNISSRAAIHPVGPPFTNRAGGTVYGMCKAALERFTTGLASEVYADGIAVNVLSPSGHCGGGMV